MAARATKFDMNQPQLDIGLDVNGALAGNRCVVCGNFASRGFRESGWMSIQVDTEIWTCFDHRKDGLALLNCLLNAASTNSTGSQNEGPAGASPEKGCPDRVAEGWSGCGAFAGKPAKDSNVVTGSESVERPASLDDPLSDPDDDTL